MFAYVLVNGCHFAQMVVLLHENIQLAKHSTFATVSSLNCPKHAIDSFVVLIDDLVKLPKLANSVL